jgi:putative ABC transport system substrate-binding protein
MNRRQFIALLGGAAAAWPMVVRAEQKMMPVVGYLGSATPQGYAWAVEFVRQGLSDLGFVEGRNIAAEYRWANEQYDRLPALATELVRRQVAVIVTTGGGMSALAAKAATTTIPIVFATGSDPVTQGLVTSLNRPGGNVTGVSFFASALAPKRLEILREIVPKASTIAMLMNPRSQSFEPDRNEMQLAAQSVGIGFVGVYAASERELESAIDTAVQQHAGALIVHNDALFANRAAQVVALASQHALPAIYGARNWMEVGGLISYGSNTHDMVRQAGVYAARILKGEKPADLPVLMPVKYELVINLKTAKALGLTVPDKLLALADEVIE